jgi:hypothetical protein
LASLSQKERERGKKKISRFLSLSLSLAHNKKINFFVSKNQQKRKRQKKNIKKKKTLIKITKNI